MSTSDNSALVSCEWLGKNLHNPKLVILDATFFLPRQNRQAQKEYRQQHIPGALFFDIDAIADLSHPLEHMLPNAQQFAQDVSELGIANHTQVIVYDNNGFFAAARAWWMFRVFGHNQVWILNGGLETWLQLQLPIQTKTDPPKAKQFSSNDTSKLVCNLVEMKLIQQQRSKQILDARSADSFAGNRALIDPKLRTGHIPGSINLPYKLLRNTQNGLLRTPHALTLQLQQSGIDLTQPIVCTCGSGVSACVLALALFEIGLTDIPVYDASWAEWGRQTDTPVETA